MHRKEPLVDKIDSKLCRTAAYDPLRGQQRDLQSHHGRQREQQNNQRQKNRRCKHIRPQPADVAGTEKPGTADEQQITDQM